jgi:hypothetical protein
MSTDSIVEWGKSWSLLLSGIWGVILLTFAKKHDWLEKLFSDRREKHHPRQICT